MRTKSYVTLLSFMTLALVIAPPTASANDTCASAEPIDGNQAKSDTVYSPALVGWGSSRFYIHTAGGSHLGYAAIPGATTFGHVQSNLGNVDLYVWDSTCTWLYCASTLGGSGVPETCTSSVSWGVHVIEVRYVSSHESHVDFTLVALN